MASEPITREELFELAASPIGGPEAREAAARFRPERDKVPAVLKEAGKRAAKIWLPRGKRRTILSEGDPAAQTDLEDAVEAAGGRRGGEKARSQEPKWEPGLYGAKARKWGVTRFDPRTDREWADDADGKVRRFGNRTAAQRLADDLNGRSS